MATTPTVSFCDKLAALINTAWAPTSPSAVQRAYQFRQPAEMLTGRQVWVMPTDYDFEAEDRGEDRVTHRVTIVVAERYTDATHVGVPDNTWLDTRVDFVYTYLVKGLQYLHSGPLNWSGRSVVWKSADVQVCDLEKLTTTPSLFWAVVDLVFEEVQAV